MSNKVLRDEQDLGFRFATFFDPRCGFGLIEAMDQKAGSQFIGLIPFIGMDWLIFNLHPLVCISRGKCLAF